MAAWQCAGILGVREATFYRVRAGRLTRAAAAQALGLTLDAFLIEAGRHGLYAIDYDVDDFTQELDAIAAERH